MQFKIGDIVKVPCTFQPGAFNDERLVIINTGDEQISGFIKSKVIAQKGEEEGYLQGKIIDTQKEGCITVQLPGSFFTIATGQASLSTDWAKDNLKPAVA